MPRPRPADASASVTDDLGTTALLAAVFGIASCSVLLWAGGGAAAVVTGYGWPHAPISSGLRILAHPGDPTRAWHTPMPGPLAYWAITVLVLLAVTTAAVPVVRWWRDLDARRRTDPGAAEGLATRAEVTARASDKALLRNAAILRPSLTRPAAPDVGYRVGTSRGVPVWTSVEDSVLVLGPPRSGKGLHLIIPMILDAPGPVITTSTRPDNLTVTLNARRNAGPVAVFDPQGLAPRHVEAMKWSPIRGCHDPQTAMIRARALAEGTSDGVENGGFWRAQTEIALRAFLHAAALDGRSASDLYRWSVDPVAAGEATRILAASAHAAPGWGDALDAIINGDPRTRDNSWAEIRVALSALADPRVLAAVQPSAGDQFDPTEFLAGNGTLYLLGTSSGAGAAAGIVAAFIEDIVEQGRRLGAASPGTRLDPPLALILDEAANYALPSLPALVSEGGGTGITTIAALQSLAQARARWGEHHGAAIWDAASVKIILGGGSNARDLHDLAALIGDRDEQSQAWSRDTHGRRSTSASVRRVPILDPGQLRTLPFGTAILLHRAARPIAIDLTPWITRRGLGPSGV
jgi:type IV secretion system protein VirD4